MISLPPKRILWVLGIASVLLGALFLALCWLSSSRLICPPRRALQDYHREILMASDQHAMRVERFLTGGAPCLMCEPLSGQENAPKGRKIREQLAATGVLLSPWGDVRATLVLLHGHTGRKEDHLPVAERFCAAGFRCILVDLPGHGDHPEPFASFGVTESAIPEAALNEAALRFKFSPAPCGLFGISQGGAIALQAAARPGAAWFAVAELSAFSSLDDVIQSQAQRLFGPVHPVAQDVVRSLVRLRAGYDPAVVRPVDAVKAIPCPVLIGHGDDDRFVPPEHAQRLLQAVVPGVKKQFLDIPHAGHHNILITDAPVYATIASFFLAAL